MSIFDGIDGDIVGALRSSFPNATSMNVPVQARVPVAPPADYRPGIDPEWNYFPNSNPSATDIANATTGDTGAVSNFNPSDFDLSNLDLSGLGNFQQGMPPSMPFYKQNQITDGIAQIPEIGMMPQMPQMQMPQNLPPALGGMPPQMQAISPHIARSMISEPIGIPNLPMQPLANIGNPTIGLPETTMPQIPLPAMTPVPSPVPVMTPIAPPETFSPERYNTQRMFITPDAPPEIDLTPESFIPSMGTSDMLQIKKDPAPFREAVRPPMQYIGEGAPAFSIEDYINPMGLGSLTGNPVIQEQITPTPPPKKRPRDRAPRSRIGGGGRAAGGMLRYQEGQGIAGLGQEEAMMTEGNDQLIQATMMAIQGMVGDQATADAIINQFIGLYGEEAFLALREQVLNPDGQAQTQGMIEGFGGGMDDFVQGVAGNQERIAASPGEYIVPADVVSQLGDGNSEEGSRKLDGMLDRTRMAKTGTREQAEPIDSRMVMPV
tara:strand:+ start:140 stop:1612 length:1473 start_codon:yes stop_codon:yes gene_type:complete